MAPTGAAGLICLAWIRGRGSQIRGLAGACHPFSHRKEMALTIVETRAITGGVDTHADVHAAAALDPVGGLLGVREFPASPAGYARLLDWLGGFGTVCLAGIEGTGSYGAGLARYVSAAGVRVVEVDRSDRQDRHRQGKSDPLDAVSAARAAQSGRARGAPKGRDGAVEAIRALMVTRRSAARERTQTINQARALILAGPNDLRARFARHTPAALVAGIAALRPRPGDVVGYATRIALRELGRRVQFPGSQLARLDELIVPLVTVRAPACSPSTGSAPTPRHCCSSLRAIILDGSAPRPPGRTCALPPRSPPPQGKSPATGSTPAVAVRPATPYGGSRSPAWAPTRPPVPTSSAAPKKASPRRRSSAASRDTPPARSTRTCAPPRADAPSRGRPDPIFGCRTSLAFERFAGRPRVPSGLLTT
jgi:transposase